MKAEYINLRNTDEGLAPVGKLKIDTSLAGWKPLCRIASKMLYTKGNYVAIGSTSKVINIGSEATAALPNGDNGALAMTGEGALIINADSTVESATPDFPAVALIASDGGMVSTDVPYRRISSSSPSDSDIAKITADLCKAYCRLAASGASQGIAIQPALARYRLLDAAGNELFTSPPVLLQHSDGAQCADTYIIYSRDGGAGIDPYTLTAVGWRLRLVLPAASDAAHHRAARLDLLMTPLFHPLDGTQEAEFLPATRTDASQPFAHIALPGRQAGLASDFGENSCRIVREAIARIAGLEQCVASVANPFGTEERTISPDISFEIDPAADARKIKSALTKPVKKLPSTDVWLAKPHTLKADMAAKGSAVVAWSGISALPYKGWSLGTFATGARTAKAWKAVTAVVFRDGTGVLRTEEHSSGAFASIGPILAYPSPDAVEMRIWYYSEGVVRAASYNLTPEASGRYAIHIMDKALAWPIAPAPSAQMPEIICEPRRLDGVVAFADASNPLAIKASATIDNATITAILARNSTDLSWEVGRARFMAATSTAIYSIAVNSAFRSIAVRTVSNRGIADGQGLCAAPDAAFYAAATHAGDSKLVKIDKNGHVSSLKIDKAPLAVAYDNIFNELWVFHIDGTATILPEGNPDKAFTRTDTSMQFLRCSNEGETFVVSDYSLARIGDESSSVSAQIAARYTFVPTAYRMTDAQRFFIPMTCSAFEGTITVEGTTVADAHPWLMRELKISGAIAGPIEIPVLARQCRAATLTVDARVSPDFRLLTASAACAADTTPARSRRTRKE